MNIKKIVLWGSIGALVFLVLLGVGQAKFGLVCTYETNKQSSYEGGFIPGGNGERYPDIIYFERAEWCKPLARSLLPFLPLLLLSLLTYRMHDSVFRAWFRFAVWFVPVIIAVALWLEANDHGGGWGVGSGLGTIFILVPLYAIFVFTSLWKIVRAYGKVRNKKNN